MMGRSTGCATHRPALLAFAERSEQGPDSPAAFAHLDGCRRCQADLAEIVLTVHAVRRALAEARAVDPQPDGWERLRERVQRPVAGAWAARTSLAGLIVGAGLVAALIGPTANIRPTASGLREPGPRPADLAASTKSELRGEAAPLNRPRIDRTVVSAAAPVVSDATWSGPDGLGRTAAAIHVDIPPARAD
jgi:anti-sigma factor RsiW